MKTRNDPAFCKQSHRYEPFSLYFDLVDIGESDVFLLTP